MRWSCVMKILRNLLFLLWLIGTLCYKVVDFVVMLVWFCLYPLATVFRVMTRGRCGLWSLYFLLSVYFVIFLQLLSMKIQCCLSNYFFHVAHNLKKNYLNLQFSIRTSKSSFNSPIALKTRLNLIIRKVKILLCSFRYKGILKHI